MALANAAFCFKNKKKEIIGQPPPGLRVGGAKSFIGATPIGNTGGANVPPLKPMEIRDDLKHTLEAYK